MGRENFQINKVLRARANRVSRLSHEWKTPRRLPELQNFLDWSGQCIKAGELIINGKIDDEISTLLARSVVITQVTACEVFCRDILYSLLSRAKANNGDIGNLKKIYTEKFDIIQLIDLLDKSIDPLEVVVSSLSFQSVAQIDRVFSALLGENVWDVVLDSEFAIARSVEDIGSENIMTWSQNDKEYFSKLFDLRHELVHDPSRLDFFSDDVLNFMISSESMIIGLHMVIHHLARKKIGGEV